MAIINVTFHHQTDGSFVEAKVDTSWSADFAISELIRKGLVEEYVEKGRIRFRRVGSSSGSGTGIGGRMPHYN